MARDLVNNLKFKKNTGNFDPDRLAKMLTDGYIGNSNNPKFMKKTTFSPSTVGYGHGNCARYWYIAFEGTEFENTFDAIAIANMANGTAAHERIQKIFESTGTVKVIEQEIIKEDPPVKGFADVILDWEGTEVVGEIKTTSDNAFLFRQNSMKPSDNHRLQILIYMDVRGAEEGFLLYENKDNQQMLIIPVKMNDANREFLDKCYDWMRETRKAWEDKDLPARPFRKNNKICTDCPVRTTCFGMEDTEKLIPVLKL
jgi:CRISPR/Cas system-associated exonuclease Cas4 (RecB family)